jgi:hypothetical protein
MFKFADSNNNNVENILNYKMTITNPIDNSIVLGRLGSTSNSADLQVIDRNTFSKGGCKLSNVDKHFLSINGQNVNKNTKLPILLKVV